jgi:hypothetical protein
MIVETLKASHSNGLGDVAEWLRSGLQIRAKTLQKQRPQRETTHPNNRERIVILGNRFSAHARPAFKAPATGGGE